MGQWRRILASSRHQARLFREFAALILSMVLTVPAPGWAEAESYFDSRDRTGFSAEPVTNAWIDKSIAEDALFFKKHGAGVDRIGFHDIAYPKDSDEFRGLSGYGLLTVMAIAHDSTEIPLKRVYIKMKDKEEELVRVFTIRSAVTPQDGPVAKTFGRFRADAMYLFPVHYKFKASELLADFARNRKGFGLAAFPGKPLPILKGLPQDIPGSLPAWEVIVKFAQREYPDLSRFLTHLTGWEE